MKMNLIARLKETKRLKHVNLEKLETKTNYNDRYLAISVNENKRETRLGLKEAENVET